MKRNPENWFIPEEPETIKVTKDYTIEIDDFGFTVRKRKRIKWFSDNLVLALRFIRNDLLKRDIRTEAKTLDDAISIIIRERKEFEEYVKTALANMTLFDPDDVEKG